MKSGNILVAVLAGAAVGILLAPDKGSNTRRKIIEGGEDYLDLFKSKLDSLIATASDKLNIVKNDAENLLDKGMAEFADKKDEFTNKIVHNNKI